MTGARAPDGIRCIAFDFDGTLVESNPIKRDAYYAVFASVPGSAAVLEHVIRANPEADRHGIVHETRRALEDCGARSLPSAEELVRAYGRLCEEGVSQCAPVPGAVAALRALAPCYPLYIASATPEAPLRRVVARRGWAGFFRAVLGRPATKTENLRTIAAREGIGPEALLLVGDGPPDRRAARTFGCRFAGFEAPAAELLAHPRLAVLAPLAREICARSPAWGAPRGDKPDAAG